MLSVALNCFLISDNSNSGVNRRTTRNIRQKAIVKTDESQRTMKIDAPETARVAISKLNFAFFTEFSSINLSQK